MLAPQDKINELLQTVLENRDSLVVGPDGKIHEKPGHLDFIGFPFASPYTDYDDLELALEYDEDCLNRVRAYWKAKFDEADQSLRAIESAISIRKSILWALEGHAE